MKSCRKWLTISFLTSAAALILGGGRSMAQTNGRVPLGSMQTHGTVFVGGIPATPEITIYPGDAVRTGADGTANLAMPDRGTIMIGMNSEIAFLPNPVGGRLASLHSGNIALHLQSQTYTTTVEIGQFVLTTESNTEASAEVDMNADGSAHIRCLAGSIGVIQIEGLQTDFLKPGEEATTSADGKLTRLAPAAAPVPTAIPAIAGKSHAVIILLAAGGGAAAAAAAIIATHHNNPVSPSAP